MNRGAPLPTVTQLGGPQGGNPWQTPHRPLTDAPSFETISRLDGRGRTQHPKSASGREWDDFLEERNPRDQGGHPTWSNNSKVHGLSTEKPPGFPATIDVPLVFVSDRVAIPSRSYNVYCTLLPLMSTSAAPDPKRYLDSEAELKEDVIPIFVGEQAIVRRYTHGL